MNLRGAAILILLAGGAAWIATTRRPMPVTEATAPEFSTPIQVAQSLTHKSEAELSEPDTDSETTLEPPGPVLSRPRPAVIAAVEERPLGPEDGESGFAIAPVTNLENMRSVFRHYSSRCGGNPVGDNSEITAALNGRNARQVVFLNPEDGLKINAQGELVDNWNTPYFFHQLSRAEMEIRSAGPDRRMWTLDDLVIK